MRNIACIGAGYWGNNLVRNFHELGALRSVCELDSERRAQLSSHYPNLHITDSVDDVLSDPEVTGVAIATPVQTHGDLVRTALLADRDVLVEKPLCLSVREGQELVQLASDTARLLMVGHILWYHPAVVKLKELIDSGELGRIQYIYSSRLNLGKIRREENILWSFAPHDISMILGLVGEMPETVYAQGGNYLHKRIADVTMSILTFPSGIAAHIFVSWLHPFKEQKLVVVGDRKMALFDDTQPENKLILYPHSIDWRKNVPVASKAKGQPIKVDSTEPLKAECQAFIESMQTRSAPRTDGEEGLRVLRVLERCQQALELEETPSAAVAPEIESALPYFVHESSYVDDGVEIGEGTNIWHFSHVMKNSRLGRDCRIGQNVLVGPNVSVGDSVKIQNNVSVYEGVTLEDYVFCGPSMVFTNVYNPRSEIRRMSELRPTLVRRGATLGANSTIICGVTIGQYAFVGAGAVVLDDVPDYALIVGNPGRIVGWMCVCGNRIHFDDTGQAEIRQCSGCERVYRKDGEQVRLK